MYSLTNLVHEMPHELLNDIRLRILGNQGIFEKFQMRVKSKPSAKSSIPKLNVDKSCQKTRKIRYYSFEVLPNFTVLIYFTVQYFGQDCLRKQISGRNLGQSHLHQNFWLFHGTSKHLSNHDVNKNEVSSVKSPKFSGFVLALFCFLGLGQKVTLENFQLC